jgi:hypothetical protein
MTWCVVAALALVAALVPAVTFHRNQRLYAPPPSPEPGERLPAVSVLIPARNEARVIGDCLAAALASERIEFEVVVLDDGSTDETAAIVKGLAERHVRLRYEPAPPLPAGWCGKQHACAVLAELARHDVLVFLDADVRLTPRGLVRSVAFLQRSGADLVSGVPRQVTRTLAEHLVVPLIHFALLGLLPLWRMRASTHPAYGSGCGQLFVARRAAYRAAGGHGAIRASLHDGLQLPRAFRRAGLRTDLFDATEVAACRMYRGAGEVWRGFAKNATEGLAAPRLIVGVTVFLLLGQVLPAALLLAGLTGALPPAALALAMAANVAAYYPRVAAVDRFAQPVAGALLHPLGVLVLLAIQWWALARRVLGRGSDWKGRRYG